nr:hypothetical protein [uncultured Mediterraneibacter sp.]
MLPYLEFWKKAAKYQYNGLGHRGRKLEGSLPAARMEQLEKYLNPRSRIHMEIGNQQGSTITCKVRKRIRSGGEVWWGE